MGVVAAGLYGYATVARPRLLRSGATADEIAEPYPGAGLVPNGRRTSTMAVTLNASPAIVWPWLTQMGADRAGWYSWDRLDNGGRPSADRVHSEWQQLAVGDRLATSRDGKYWFEVAACEPERFLALRAPLDLARAGRPFDPAGPRPACFSDSTWCFLLCGLPDGRTRLVVSGYAASRPRFLTSIFDFLVWEPGHWIMQTRQFANLAQRVTADGRRDGTSSFSPDS